jgi:hypothetical protein
MIPKYRAWHKTWKEMGKISWMLFHDDGKVDTVLFNGRDFDFKLKIDKIELMQSTDLKDKNGKEIFEGDIVKMAKDFYSEPAYYEVIRHRGGAYRLESNQHGCELWLRHTNCEVIGNIYENPELLEVAE